MIALAQLPITRSVNVPYYVLTPYQQENVSELVPLEIYIAKPLTSDVYLLGNFYLRCEHHTL